jgi:hypothetical protein
MAKSHLLVGVVIAIALSALIAVMNAVNEQGISTLADIKHVSVEDNVESSAPEPLYDYNRLRHAITTGQATLADARRAMTDTTPASLSNSIHAFYSMRRHRGVIHLLNGMWTLDKEKYPELAWDLIAKPPARIALASTINRNKIIGTDAQKDYIREHKNDDHEFIRAQVAVALGFNGDLADLPYLESMADGDNHYVAQSAITGLSLFGGEKARDILIKLSRKHAGTSRGDLMSQMLKQVFHWSPRN